MEDALGKAEAVEERRPKNGARIAAGAKGAIEVNFNLASISAAIQYTETHISGIRLFCGGASRRRLPFTALAACRRSRGGVAATKENRREGEKRGRAAGSVSAAVMQGLWLV